MKNLHIGQEVVYIKRTIPEWGLIKNKIYTIQEIARCGCSVNIHVGLMHNMTSSQCPTCCETICYDQRFFLNEEAFEPVVPSLEIEHMMNELPEVPNT